MNKKAFCVLEFAKTESIVTVRRRFETMYRTEPPTDKTIREWYMRYQQSGCLCAAKRRGRPGPSANSKTQNAFLFTVHAIFRHDNPLAVEPASTPRPLVQKKIREILYLFICPFLSCLSWLLRSRVRKFRRDL